MEENKPKLNLEAEVHFDVEKVGRDKRRWDESEMQYGIQMKKIPNSIGKLRFAAR